ncbi:hypothetical protein MNBD_ALPHA01-1306, partial [hydrothermal vent metagenome]
MSTSSMHLPAVRRHMALFWAVCSILMFSFPALGQSDNQSGNLDSYGNKAENISFSIKAQPLRSALIDFSKQSGIQLIYVADEGSAPNSPGLAGNFTIRQALAILLRNSGF